MRSWNGDLNNRRFCLLLTLLRGVGLIPVTIHQLGGRASEIGLTETIEVGSGIKAVTRHDLFDRNVRDGHVCQDPLAFPAHFPAEIGLVKLLPELSEEGDLTHVELCRHFCD